MSRVKIMNFAKMTGIKQFKNHYVRFEYEESGIINEKFFEKVNGVDRYYENLIVFGFHNHNMNFSGNQAFQTFFSLFCGRISIFDIIERADEHKKTIIGYLKVEEKKFLIKCNICGYEKMQFARFFHRCKGCDLKSRVKPFIQFKSEANVKHDEKYLYFSDGYVNNNTKIKILCKTCNYIFEQLPRNHLSGYGCPKCTESKGENKVAKYLSDNNIRYIKNKIFKTLKDKSYLKPDFYLTSDNLLIEYDGEGHYFPVFGTTPEEKQKNFEDCQRRDKIKNEWAKANNIPLLRIPYWDFDRIEELIEAFILQHTKKKEIKQLVMEI
jgi:hypothetical protein